MRDAHRMKERFDLSLDSRQVVSLLIGGIVVIGAVFVLGVVVGKQLAGNEETRQAGDILSALDRQAEKAAEAEAAPREELPLTFQDELTKKAETPKPAATTTPAVAKAAPPPTASPATAAATTPAGATPATATATPSPSAPMAGKVDEGAVTTRAAERDGGLERAFARAAATSTPVRPPSEAVTGGAFTLQISASQSREEADRFVTRLRDRGYAPYIRRAEVPGRGTWYRVRMGSFPSKDAAQRYLADFKRETQYDAFVTAND